jgi:carboxyl-terminal processing protease
MILQRDSNLYISEPYENMPAHKAGLHAGDKFISVDGMPCYGKSTKELSDHLRGVPGTTVTIVVERDNKQITKEVTRQDIYFPAVGITKVFQDSIGYIMFNDFTQNSAQEFLIALDQLVQEHHIKGLIIDIRGNGGGLISEATKILSFFLPKGTEVVSTKGKVEKSCYSYTTTTNPIYPDMPLVVMVDNNSASASEILAGALQDLKRATLVGQRTYGKGLVQNIRPVAYGGYLKVTTAKYYLPSGRCIQAIDYAERQKGNKLEKDTAGGILPDVVIPDSQKIDICYSLYRDHMCFDYATLYHKNHPQITSADQFKLTDADIEDFCQFLEEKEFTYQTEAGRYFTELIDLASKEHIDSATIAELKAMQPKLSFDLRTAIQRYRTEVEELLGSEIIKRYYFQKGYYTYMLRFDPEVKRALEELTK